MVGGGCRNLRPRSFASLWHGPLPPLFPGQEGQVVAGILQLAPAMERFANHSGMEIPQVSYAQRMQCDPLSHMEAVPHPGFVSITRRVDRQQAGM